MYTLFHNCNCLLPADQTRLLDSGNELLLLKQSPGLSDGLNFRDLTNPRRTEPLKAIGIISAHTRPVQCFAVDAQSSSSATLYTADSMGLIKVWTLERTYGDAPNCRATEREELILHRTGINEMWLGHNQLWTGRLILVCMRGVIDFDY